MLPGGSCRISLATRPVDIRKAHAGLWLIVREGPGRDLCSGAIFVFRSGRGDRMKCLVREQTGLVLIYKKLEGGAFHWPTPSDGMIRLSPAQDAALFEGIDWRAVRAQRRRPKLAG